MYRNKINIDVVRNAFSSEGYVLKSTEYVNSRQKLDYICPNGHKHCVAWGHWISGRRCPFCSNKVKKTIGFVRSEFEKEGYILVSKKYVNANTKLEFICPKGHKHSITWHNWDTGRRCGICAGKYIDYGSVSSEFSNEGYKLLSNTYINAHSFLEYECPNGHRNKIRWHNWKSGKRCPECAVDGKRIDLDIIKSSLRSDGYILLSDNYKSSKDKLLCRCPNGHMWEFTWSTWNAGHRCGMCFAEGQSRAENEIYNYVKSFCFDAVFHDRSIITPYELDIVIPSKSIAIEYCGLYWHSETVGKCKNYHLKKLEVCRSLGYRLIIIFEDEWINNKEIVISRINNVLGNIENKIYARNCCINEITTNEAKNFCIVNHLQGYNLSSVKLGAFYNDELVSVMTFSKPSISKGYRKYGKDVFELNRFCSKLGYVVIGIASKMLKFFENNFRINKIISYADRRWSDGSLYNNLGFEFVDYTPPNYWYFVNGTTKRIHRFALRKNKHDSKNNTEYSIRLSEGYHRIWDCGNIKFEKEGCV